MNSVRRLIVSADDLGLTRGSSDAIFEAVDAGMLTSVSILANGPAFGYAIDNYKLRSHFLTLRVHLNLTEGKPVHKASEVPLLVDARGYFKPLNTLVCSYFLSTPSVRRNMCEQISLELKQQMHLVFATGVTQGTLHVDGHQHVHLLPFVFNEIIKLKEKFPITYIRTVREPLNVTLDSFLKSPFHFVTHTIVGGYTLALLSEHACKKAEQANISTNDWFVGMRHSGRMTEKEARSGLRAVVAEEGVGETEILFHPGSVSFDEKLDWNGDLGWHHSPKRIVERVFLTSMDAPELFDAFRNGTLVTGQNLDRVVRYVVSGGFAATAHLGTLFICTSVFHIWYLGANIVAFCIGLVVSFGLQKFWTFEDTRTEKVRFQALSYASIQMVSLAINTGLFYLLVEQFHIWYLGAQFLILTLLAVGNFFIFNLIIFKRSHGTS